MLARADGRALCIDAVVISIRLSLSVGGVGVSQVDGEATQRSRNTKSSLFVCCVWDL